MSANRSARRAGGVVEEERNQPARSAQSEKLLDEFITSEQLCAEFNICLETLYRWDRAGKAAPFVRIGNSRRYTRPCYVSAASAPSSTSQQMFEKCTGFAQKLRESDQAVIKELRHPTPPDPDLEIAEIEQAVNDLSSADEVAA